jgi:hypothetical protein
LIFSCRFATFSINLFGGTALSEHVYMNLVFDRLFPEHSCWPTAAGVLDKVVASEQLVPAIHGAIGSPFPKRPVVNTNDTGRFDGWRRYLSE